MWWIAYYEQSTALVSENFFVWTRYFIISAKLMTAYWESCCVNECHRRSDCHVDKLCRWFVVHVYYSQQSCLPNHSALVRDNWQKLISLHDSGVWTKSTMRGQGQLEAWRAEPEWSYLLGRGGKPPYSPARGPGERCKLPGHLEFWCIMGSLGALFCSPAMQNCACAYQQQLSYTRFQHSGGEGPCCPRGSDAFVMWRKPWSFSSTN